MNITHGVVYVISVTMVIRVRETKGRVLQNHGLTKIIHRLSAQKEGRTVNLKGKLYVSVLCILLKKISTTHSEG